MKRAILALHNSISAARSDYTAGNFRSSGCFRSFIMRQRAFHSWMGFTIVELLVVIGIIGVIIGLVLPALARVRAESQSTNCLSNLRQLFAAIETNRSQRKDLLPYAAPLPSPPDTVPVVPSLPKRLEKILPIDSPAWMCPADTTDASAEIGTSYIYAPGAFMLSELPMPSLSQQAHEERVARLITLRFTDGYLKVLPILADSGEYHTVGSREPYNGVYMDGSARILKPLNEQDQEQVEPSSPP